MTDQIISRERIRARAKAAFEAGQARDSHHMNWHSAALEDWLAEYDRLLAQNGGRRPTGAALRKQKNVVAGAQ